MKLIPIGKTVSENQAYLLHPDCQEIIYQTVDFYNRIGYDLPWVGYLAQVDGQLVGSAGYKGKPVHNTVEIAYSTFPAFRGKGIGTQICRQLVVLALKTDPAVRITARTLPEHNESGSILTKNGFVCLGTVYDPEDGNVWEWEYQQIPAPHIP